jgi:hypothetical protein
MEGQTLATFRLLTVGTLYSVLVQNVPFTRGMDLYSAVANLFHVPESSFRLVAQGRPVLNNAENIGLDAGADVVFIVIRQSPEFIPDLKRASQVSRSTRELLAFGHNVSTGAGASALASGSVWAAAGTDGGRRRSRRNSQSKRRRSSKSKRRRSSKSKRRTTKSRKN